MSSAASSNSSTGWERILQERLPLYGHRNWIVVADSAYPAQSHPAIETVFSGADQIAALTAVVAALRSTAHVRPIIHADQELSLVSENDAPGVDSYRKQLTTLVGKELKSTPHEEIISMLDRAAQLFRVLIIKTTMTIPYTSVFFELDCAYWNADSERRLRSAMASQG